MNIHPRWPLLYSQTLCLHKQPNKVIITNKMISLPLVPITLKRATTIFSNYKCLCMNGQEKITVKHKMLYVGEYSKVQNLGGILI